MYNQSETHAALEAFMAHPELKTAMMAAGVKPDTIVVSSHDGGWSKMY